MADIDWPATLYGYILADGFQEITPDNLIRTEMEVGPAKVRRRGTAAVRKFSVQMFFTAAKLATFETFYVTTSKNGSLAFSYYAPRTKTLADHRFASIPSYSQRDSGFVVSFQLEQMP